MDHVLYISNGDTYEIRTVSTYVEADEDVKEVLHLLGDTSLDVYKANMYKSVDQGYAFRILKNWIDTGFVYSYIENNRYLGASILLNGTITMILGLKHIFEVCDKHKIEFKPHGDIDQFKSMITGTSLRVYNSMGGTVTILRSEVEAKGRKIYDYLKIQCKEV